MTWVHVPAEDPVTGTSNLNRYSNVAQSKSAILDMCIPGIWCHAGSDFITLNDDIAHWLACRVDDYHLHNANTKMIDFHHSDQGVDVWIDDPKIAMLFKLIFGGPKELVRP